MTHRPTLDSAEQTPGLPAPSSANGSQRKSTLQAARDPAGVAIDAVRHAADLNGMQRAVDLGAAERPQTQERLTMQVAKYLDAELHPRGVGVVLEAEHTCMTQRGIRALGATTVTSALLGTLRTDPRSRAEFFALARVPTSPAPM